MLTRFKEAWSLLRGKWHPYVIADKPRELYPLRVLYQGRLYKTTSVSLVRTEGERQLVLRFNDQ